MAKWIFFLDKNVLLEFWIIRLLETFWRTWKKDILISLSLNVGALTRGSILSVAISAWQQTVACIAIR